jgi:hypothetical protein
MISGMKHETLKSKGSPFSLTGWAKQWYKLHVSSCYGSWVVLKDQLCFTFFPLSKIIDLHNQVLNFDLKLGESFRSSLVQIQSTCFVGSRVIYSRFYFYAAFCARVGYGIH